MGQGVKWTKAKKKKTIEGILTYYEENPSKSLEVAIKRFKIAKQTFYNWIKEDDFGRFGQQLSDIRELRKKITDEETAEEAKTGLRLLLSVQKIPYIEKKKYKYDGKDQVDTFEKVKIILPNITAIKYVLNNNPNSGYTNDPTPPPADPGQNKDETRKQIFDEKVKGRLKQIQEQHDNNANIKT